jgi:Na+/H+ antiporter NhaA
LLSNSPWADPFLSAWQTPVGLHIGALESARSLRDWINDGLMTLFFFLVALELKRELVLGELNNPRMVALSIANLAFNPGLVDSAKPGIFLASVFSAVADIALLRGVSGPGKHADTAGH